MDANAARSHAVRLALVPGGPHPYFTAWKPAGERAAADFGIGEVAYDDTSNWDQEAQNRRLDDLAARGYTAFGVFGVSAVDINDTFGNLTSTGLVVAALASCPAAEVNLAAFCLATDVERAAYLGAKAAIAAMGGKGDLVHLTGNRVDTNTERRMAGVRHAVAETGGSVRLLATIADVDTDAGTADAAVDALLDEHGRTIDAVVATGYVPAVAAVAGVGAAGLPIRVVAIDDDPVILDGIRDGSVEATVVQNPEGQAYVGAWALTQLAIGECTLRQPGVFVDSGSFVVDAGNVDTYDALREAKTAALRDEFLSTVLAC
ncbi:sugar ABC transporter substrate-binding protein [Actinokineospora soli]